ncbi:hypothetical protein [Candidatus Entotheonella palauensis]|nr:hypothetical protein [Candidatus Entotheonella palauensis]
MTAADLLHQLNRLGVHLAANGDRLVCEAPKGVLTAGITSAAAVAQSGVS